MSYDRNALGQLVGFTVDGWKPALAPTDDVMVGRYCRVERLNPTLHAAPLLEANLRDPSGANWTYLPYGPFDDLDSYRMWVEEMAPRTDPMFFTVVDAQLDRAVGVASYLRIDQDSGSIEVGHINYSPLLQRQRAGTEAMYLMMKRVFDDLGYRRYEWKCNALNQPSRVAATRLGYTYEGTFRQSNVVKGRNRDTAWYSVLDTEWPRLKRAFERWLEPTNFDPAGTQHNSLTTDA